MAIPSAAPLSSSATLATELQRLAARTRGAPTAPLTVLELSDFQCDDCCRHAREVMPVLERRYIATGLVRWVFVNWPKGYKHPHAVRAAEYALAAGRQGRFWAMHDALFAGFERWRGRPDPTAEFDALATESGVDLARLAREIDDGMAADDLRRDAEYIARWGVGYVPSFDVGGMVVEGAHSADYLSGVIDAVLRGHARTLGG